MIGLDISSSSAKLVELGQDRSGNLTLERCGIEPLERGWISDGNIEKFDEVVEATRRLVGKSGTKAKHVAMALPASVVISKKIILPGGLSEREMEVQVESEANQYIPFSLDEVSLDFCVVGPSTTSAGDVEVVIAASRKEKVEDRQGLAEAAGLVPVVLDVESYASRLAASRVALLQSSLVARCSSKPALPISLTVSQLTKMWSIWPVAAKPASVMASGAQVSTQTSASLPRPSL